MSRLNYFGGVNLFNNQVAEVSEVTFILLTPGCQW